MHAVQNEPVIWDSAVNAFEEKKTASRKNYDLFGTRNNITSEHTRDFSKW